MTARIILALNSGSSSFKAGLYRVDAAGARVLHEVAYESVHVDAALDALACELDARALPAPEVIGHRVVHGGPFLREHARLTPAVLAQIEAARAYAPLHTPATLALIRAAQRRYPALPQVACLDTCFHATLPALAHTLPLPRPLRDSGLRRYGFHGLSCESILRQLGPAPPSRLLIAHLGNGASITAVREGLSVDTSMGLTPSGGLLMGTRSGDVDPGLMLHLLRERGYDAASLEALLDHGSGLLGVSGISGDVRRLHDAAAVDADAQLALELFAYGVRKQLAAMAAVLGGVEAIVFTGGIGEHDAALRARICEGLAWMGVTLDEVRNRTHARHLGRAHSACDVQRLPSLEDEQIARHAWRLGG